MQNHFPVGTCHRSFPRPRSRFRVIREKPISTPPCIRRLRGLLAWAVARENKKASQNCLSVLVFPRERRGTRIRDIVNSSQYVLTWEFIVRFMTSRIASVRFPLLRCEVSLREGMNRFHFFRKQRQDHAMSFQQRLSFELRRDYERLKRKAKLV